MDFEVRLPVLSRNPQRLKLIFNPGAGRSNDSPSLLQDVISELQRQNFIPEICIIEPGSDIVPILNEALKHRIKLFVVCGGDGTIENIARWMIGKRASLGIIPAGTQNNIALSLGIPSDIKAAVELLRQGPRSKIDVGLAKSGEKELPFLEVCSIGLFSALFNSADNLQKGDLTGLGDFISTLASFPSAKIQLYLDQNQLVNLNGHAALVANLPYFGLNYRLTLEDNPHDGQLDVLVFSDYSKLELVGNILNNGSNQPTDERLRRYRAHTIQIQTDPEMPAQVDGTPLGPTPIEISVKRQALSVITGLPAAHPGRFGFLHNLNILRFFRKQNK